MEHEVDVAVVGLGVMGAATLAALARRGVRTLGIERFDIPHALGSSHGGTRVTRKAYHEDPSYVPLLHRAWDAWRALEREVGDTLLVSTGGLHFGPRDEPELGRVLDAVRLHDLPHELFDRAALARRFPQFTLGPDDLALLEVDAGVLFPERCVMALVEAAQRHGAAVYAREQLGALELGADVVLTTERRTVRCKRVVMTVGPWWPQHAALRPPPAPALRVSRQVQFWVRAADPAAFAPARFPVFLSYGGDFVYGLPEAAFPGVKLAAHRVGSPASPEAIDRCLRPDDEAPVRAFIRRYLPGADGPLLGARVCMYTNSADGHFALGLHPDAPEVVVGTGFSGHGFKLAPEVGEILADYALDGASARSIPLFDLARARTAADSAA